MKRFNCDTNIIDYKYMSVNYSILKYIIFFLKTLDKPSALWYNI